MKLEIDKPPSSFHGMVGRSGLMIDLFRQISIVAKKEVKVLIQGERGTGKELVAKAIKNISARKNKIFKTINCGGLSKELLPSELWGHEKGAFTGAVTKKLGLVPACHGGTLFLDEIGDLGLEAQAMLLRFLQEGEVRPVGGLEDIHVDVRIMAATNKDLVQEMSLGRFREDLFDRLSEITLYVPPLREREKDIELLTFYLLQKYNHKHHMNVEGITKEAMDVIQEYPWPGNVRDLEKAINRAVIFSEGKKLIRKSDLGLGHNRINNISVKPVKEEKPDTCLDDDELLEEKIKPRQKEILRIAQGNDGLVDNKRLRQTLGASKEIIRKDLHYLCSLGLLEKRGQARNSVFILKNPLV